MSEQSDEYIQIRAKQQERSNQQYGHETRARKAAHDSVVGHCFSELAVVCRFVQKRQRSGPGVVRL